MLASPRLASGSLSLPPSSGSGSLAPGHSPHLLVAVNGRHPDLDPGLRVGRASSLSLSLPPTESGAAGPPVGSDARGVVRPGPAFVDGVAQRIRRRTGTGPGAVARWRVAERGEWRWWSRGGGCGGVGGELGMRLGRWVVSWREASGGVLRCGGLI
ncbi:hypothetical protein ZWY2020_007668 [Hordeum vulgare]|nr:hypothetical protein ZWY2020_007668 [Hordeum vulgare]